MNSSDSITSTTEDAVKYVAQETSIAFPNINVTSASTNEFKNLITLSQKILALITKRHRN
jgi:hypothetical protein